MLECKQGKGSKEVHSHEDQLSDIYMGIIALS